MCAERFYDHFAACQLLRRYSIPVAQEVLAKDPAHAALAAQKIGFPAVLKLLVPGISHKTDAGLVRLNLSSPADVKQAAAEMIASVGGKNIEGLLVQEMVRGGVEMIAGVVSDPQFGPVVVVGSGGTLVELLDDVTFALPPLTHANALDLLRQSASWKLLQGFRGRPAGDIAALTGLLVQLARLAMDQAGQVSSLDLNPVMVLPQGQGVRVVDYRVYGG